MYNSFLKMLLTALVLVIPALSVAADSETKAATPAQATTSTTQVKTAENNQLETQAARQSIKIGYVDITGIGSESDRGKALKALLIGRQEQLQKKIDGKRKQIEKFKTSIESKIASMAPAEREAKSREFQKKLDEFQKFARKSEEDLFALQQKETKVLYDEIEKSAVAYGSANGFALIVVKKELLYVGNSVDAEDVTEALIKALNSADQQK